MRNEKSIIPIILAAGTGTRMGNESLSLPKCFLQVKKKSLIEIQLELFQEMAIQDVIIVIGHFKEEFMSIIGRRFRSINIHYSFNEHYLSTGSAYSLLSSCNEWLKFSKPVLLMHADILFDKRIILDFFKKDRGLKNTIILDENYQEVTNDEQVVVGYENEVIELIKGKKTKGEKIGESLGINYWSTEFMEKYYKFLSSFLEKDNTYNWEQTIKKFLESDKSIKLYYSGINHLPWVNVNYPEDLRVAKEMFEDFNS